MEKTLLYLIILLFIGIPRIIKNVRRSRENQMPGAAVQKPEASAMPHKHKREGVYETYSRKTHNARPGAMPHKHETRHYTSMSDASNLPKGYILLNGEPVRVADLEGK
jgi:hypothetical protein